MEIEGKIIQILPQQSGSSSRGEWQKQDFILETQDQYPKKVCISVWNNKFEVAPLLNKPVKVSINLESREYNGRWYTDVKAWKIDLLTESEINTPGLPTDTDEIGFPEQGNEDELDDLPF